MAIGMICIPTVREEVVRLRQADLLDEVDARQLELLAHGSDEREPQKLDAPRGAAVARRLSHRHWPVRLAHTH